MDATQEVAEQALWSPREPVRGISAPVLADRGLADAVRALAELCEVPTKADVEDSGAAPAAVQAAACFVVSEALTDVAGHSGASGALVLLRVDGSAVRVRVRDDGRGGRRRRPVAGCSGCGRRVAACDGSTEPSGPTVSRS
ncbi:hypothetical protein [Streptomyces sp. MMG1121]|uniref:hypothetical protein n=1 Tax=Streptomyces sp. MMG1121 TaxID=1415544 RepID=UPI0006AE8B8A|nr:hypothetical protein [Streptomyces sp. MMG1121]